ncbi:hypothetical protein FoTM2_017770 [Fusarium oxysporum f. sp. vasinfectum]|nr:hypothetical protein FoTM2_017770 [Fusarium oxysporum f. sp. vasinfectum]
MQQETPANRQFNFEKSGLYELGAGYQPSDNWAIQSVPDWPDFAFTLPHWQTISTTEHISLLSQGVDTDCLTDSLQGPEVDHLCFEGTAPLGVYPVLRSMNVTAFVKGFTLSMKTPAKEL